ncbi:palmitoleoyl-protein carboxylesterase NOTUM [Vanessa atalanta]|uniref:palmitoleoyl-protein carboxylesterase NOTUM n=1 Tax=Vanessa atalanta TaxID=42275 RepID=UPI001FCD3C88|nr:palmitoleoyl-protein carboxylesterase NOTUM [Vanessa atalanta]XP_047530975.1 palmitoleoyl-protein carboxylesterase NOTUM [Vanessa atalanta]
MSVSRGPHCRSYWLTWTFCVIITVACESATPDSLKLVWLSNTSLTCNDGSRAGYYIRRGNNNHHWVVYLEGGGYCWDAASCGARWRRRPGLMSSSRWPRARRAPALLSSDPQANPLWHASNHVLLPYCSSDMWTGTRTLRRSNSSFAFAGRLIVRSVFDELLQLGLAGRLLLVGSSAGGTGVMFHADGARRSLRAHGIRVAAIADSGWFLDRPQKARRASSADNIARLGHSLWLGSPPTSCVREYRDKPWLCYFGYRLYPHIRTPLFVFQYLFDSAQLTAEGVRAPRTRAQWDAVHETGSAIRASLKNVRSTFAPACIAHGALARPEWLAINVSGVSLPRAISCWERRFSNGSRKERARCAPRRLVERCSWPQCNGSCPRLRDPRTGEEVALAALLQSFGLDVRGAAAAMGLDARALSRMSRAELLPLLAPHT